VGSERAGEHACVGSHVRSCSSIKDPNAGGGSGESGVCTSRKGRCHGRGAFAWLVLRGQASFLFMQVCSVLTTLVLPTGFQLVAFLPGGLHCGRAWRTRYAPSIPYATSAFLDPISLSRLLDEWLAFRSRSLEWISSKLRSPLSANCR